MKLDEDTINTIGIWCLRIALVAGAITLAALGKDDAASGCVIALIFTFFFL